MRGNPPVGRYSYMKAANDSQSARKAHNARKAKSMQAQEDREHDNKLMQRVAAGDSTAMRELAAQHLERSIGFAWKMTGSQQEAEDIVQMAMVKLWEQAPYWEPKARVGTWLYRVVYNLCIDSLRKSGRQETREDIDDIEHADAEAAMIRADRAKQVQDALTALPERQKAAIALCYFDELSQAEAGEVLSVSEKAIESLLYRAREALRDSLGELMKQENSEWKNGYEGTEAVYSHLRQR